MHINNRREQKKKHLIRQTVKINYTPAFLQILSMYGSVGV